MRFISQAVWSFLGATACWGATANAAGVWDVGLVFPRPNETYELSYQFPVLLASHHENLAKYLDFELRYTLQYNQTYAYDNNGEFRNSVSNFTDNTNDLKLYWKYFKIDYEGPVSLFWNVKWSECANPFSKPDVTYIGFSVNHSSTFQVDFEVKRGGQQVDLIAATTNRENCPDQGFAISITDETKKVPNDRLRFSIPNGTCAVVDYSPSPRPAANPCRVQTSKAGAESIETEIFKQRCDLFDPPANCPKKDHASRQLATTVIATLATAALGALGFLFA